MSPSRLKRKAITDSFTADVESGEPVSKVYDLVANITHEAAAGTAKDESIWRTDVHTQAPPGSNPNDEQWFRTQDLIVEEINKQTVFLGNTYIQVRHKLKSFQKASLMHRAW